MRFQSTPAPYPSTPLVKTLLWQSIGASGTIQPQGVLVTGASAYKSVSIQYLGNWAGGSLATVSWLDEGASHDVALADNWYPVADNSGGGWEIVLDVKGPTMQLSMLGLQNGAQVAVVGYSERIPPCASQDNQQLALVAKRGNVLLVSKAALPVATTQGPYPLPLWSGGAVVNFRAFSTAGAWTVPPFAQLYEPVSGANLLSLIGTVTLGSGVSSAQPLVLTQLPRRGLQVYFFTGTGPTGTIRCDLGMSLYGSESS
ncbi:MAG TPA: hypothetical protein VLS51_08535 [Propionibacteriaceae bacterium]|nr:hypothetical protein [Propionibacteriaceae bacterium]